MKNDTLATLDDAKSWLAESNANMVALKEWLSDTESIHTIRHEHAKAEAARAFATTLHLTRDRVNDTLEAKLWMERRMGELLASMPKAVGTKGQLVGRGVIGSNDVLPPIDPTPTLSDLGVAKIQSSRWQALAAIPEAVLQEFIDEERGDDKLLTTNGLLAQVRLERRAVQIVADLKSELDSKPIVECADALEWLDRQEQADLLLTDPPYMTDVEDIAEFAKSWLPLALAKVKPTGRAYVCVGAYPQELAAYMSVWMPTQVLVWTYRNTLGPSPASQYKQNWQAILYYAMPGAPPLDCQSLIEQFSVQDINAPDGRLGDRYHAWQKPLELAERFVRHSTKTGDTIIDPFCCTGSFLLAAAKLGREAKGCDNNPEVLKIAIERGCCYE